jgi:hypothetical protein
MAAIFTLEAVFAKKGDALLLHYGSLDDPRLIVIDGGPKGVYKKFLRPRLRQIREELALGDNQSLPIRMVMVSHIDDDHIAGVIDLLEELQEAKERRRPRPYTIDTLWHNSFDDLLGNRDPGVVSRMAATAASGQRRDLPLPSMHADTRAVVASTNQGRLLRDAARKLRIRVNAPFRGLVMAPARRKISLGGGLRFTVIGPDRDRVDELQKRWDKDLKKILEKERDSARATAFSDESPFNLASICVLAELKRKRMLLTGDARGDFVIEGLERARLLRKTRPLHVDLMKVPHHGSDRNVEESFFRRITADHYVISGDGAHGNPEVGMLKMLARARGRARYTLHFTFTADAHERERNARRKAALTKVANWVKRRPRGCKVVYQDPQDDARSVLVDLLEPLYEE